MARHLIQQPTRKQQPTANFLLQNRLMNKKIEILPVNWQNLHLADRTPVFSKGLQSIALLQIL